MRLFSLLICCFLIVATTTYAKKHTLYVGTYTNGLADGIFVYSFNDHSGNLKDLKIPVKSNNPSFLTISPDKKYLYAVGELDNMGENQSGGISAFKIGKKYRLNLINQVLTFGANPCHISLSPDGKKLIASNYTGGNLSVFNVLPNGGLSELVQRIQHEGSGADPKRQSEPHAHSAKFNATGKLVFAADLGIDELKIYQAGKNDSILNPYPQPFVKLPPGAGPRHFDFSDDGRFIYVINELNSTVSVIMKYGGEWKLIQSVKTLPKDYTGPNACADIHLSADGRFVYGSNRGHNSIAVFSRDQTNGKLELIETVSVEGDWPRNFTLDPSGKFMLVANQRSNDITVFKVDKLTGKLKFTGHKIANESPVCLQFLD